MLSIIMLNIVKLSAIMLSVIMLNVVMLSGIMLNVIMLSVIMLNIVMLSVVMLNVVVLTVAAPCIPHGARIRVGQGLLFSECLSLGGAEAVAINLFAAPVKTAALKTCASVTSGQFHPSLIFPRNA
jgi:hypothetical protein